MSQISKKLQWSINSGMCTWAFAATKFNEISGYHLHQVSVLNWHFKDHLSHHHHHHQGSLMMMPSVQYRHLTWLMAWDFIESMMVCTYIETNLFRHMKQNKQQLPIFVTASIIWTSFHLSTLYLQQITSTRQI
jgi:hypothetical protein